MPTPLRWSLATRACRGGGHDRVAAFASGDRVVIALADGAGGTGRGAAAAQAVVDAAARWATADAAASIPDADAWAARLAALDADPRALAGGQATAVVVAIDASGLAGASVGDSVAWLVDGAIGADLTAHQHRKPLLGSGRATPVPFTATALAAATLVVASDGLASYARPDDVARLARGPDLAAAAAALVDLVRLPSGDVPDDVAIALCRAEASHVDRL